MTASTVAALLTILGFSLYDTIVVFDRVRENIPRMPNAAFSQIYNRSMSEVIVRSLATSFCAALPILALMLFRRRDAPGLRVRAAHRHALGHLLVGVHRRPGAHALEGARARVPGARGAHPQQFGGEVPAYAVATAGAPVDVAPKERKRRRDRVTQPDDPSRGVSREEFDDMVRDLGIEEEPQPAASPPRPARGPAGGRRARSEANGGPRPRQPPAAGGDGEKPKKPRNRRHGRPR